MRAILAVVNRGDQEMVRSVLLRERVLYFGWGLLTGAVGIVIALAVVASANP